MNAIEKDILKQITPTQKYKDELKKILNEIKIIIKKEIKKRKLPIEIKLVGSIAKDTYLMNNMDIDFFLCYPKNYKKEEIAKQTLSIGKTFLKKTEESYAEHPYLRGYYKDYYIELVPCYKIENADQILSAVDRTPLHTKYVKENLKEKQKKDVRLFKQFLKGINCYGAEAQIQGFSGYLCELIILRYKTFKETIKNASNWKKQTKISLTKQDFQDFKTPLVFIDPVDFNRNVASAVVEKKYDLFKKACKKYLEKPEKTFFFPNAIKPWNIEKIKKTIKKQDCKYIGIKFEKPDIIDENLYPQIRKTVKSLSNKLKRNDFKIYHIKYYLTDENIYIIIKTEKEQIEKTKIHVGPPVTKKENSKKFLKKWNNDSSVVKKPHIKNNRWQVEINRKYIKAEDLLKEEFEKLSLGKHIDKIVNKKYYILNLDDLLFEDLRIFWTKHLDEKNSWER